ncbi:Response regulator (plasmid) [Cupriavidus taiwanensis]|uniref:Response regulator n=2 Tax=Cupriavidus TaxID=106589 RepID=A0A375I9M1_9BURK|nr:MULTISPECIES: DNA-binding response regulator [Cupriavidus]MBB3010064.1 DNA-binding NarL/FixJ family response regulator [Cupriavidus alkaliphilus]PVY80474.1 hypothetical protein C7414_103248 [Cupriavidus alkaliphilus]SPK70581.1 Response regulator [Cupriavidus taiwanensis]SPK77044.1 Response regulator [Cupriavidus taiwanensis]
MRDANLPHLPTLYLVEPSGSLRARQLNMLARISGIRVIAAGASASAELASLTHYHPDIVVIGLRSASARALHDIRAIRSALPDCVLVVVVDPLAQPLRHACLKAGSDYCFDRTLELEALRATLDRLAANAYH